MTQESAGAGHATGGRRGRRGGGSNVNMADIARAAGVSMATTSRAMNDLPGVAPSTRARVLQVAEELSYVVSPEAAGLSGGATGRVAVVMPHVSRWFFAEMLNGIERVLREANLDLLLYHIGERQRGADFFRDLPARRKVDAVLVVGIPVTEAERERLSLMGVGIFAAGGQYAPYPYVTVDDVEAGTVAMNHLIRLGHRRIAMVDAVDPHASSWPVDGRALAYERGIASLGQEVDPALFRRVPWGPASGSAAVGDLLALDEPPTAVFVHSDEIAFGVLRTIRRAGLRVPQDVSVIGVDDHPFSELVDLTTVGQDVLMQGQLAAELVVSALSGNEPPPATILPVRLVPRGSTATPPV